MKNYSLIAILFVVMGFIACSKGGSVAPVVKHIPNPDSLDAMVATLGADSWAADTISGFLIPIGNDSGKYNLSITGKRVNNNSLISLYISNYTGKGVYYINPPTVSATYYYQGSVRHYAISGQLIISNDSTADMRGTFNFITDSTGGMNVTDGTFRLSL